MGTKISEAIPVVELSAGHKLPALREDGSNAVAQVPAGGFAKLQAAQTFSGAQRSSETTLVSASGVLPVDMSLNNDFEHVTSENTTLQNPSNAVSGQKGRILIVQGATARTLAYGSAYRFPGGTVPSLSTTPGVTDILYYDVISPGKIAVNLVKGFAA